MRLGLKSCGSLLVRAPLAVSTKRWIGLIAALMIVVAAQALGENWMQFATSKDGDLLFVDADSLFSDGTFVHMWIKSQYAAPQTNSDGKRYVLALEHYLVDCKHHTSALATYTLEDAEHGNVVSRVDLSQNGVTFAPRIPGSIGEQQVQIACSYLALVRTPSPAPEPTPATQPTREAAAYGSGFIVATQGLVVTNSHVVHHCRAIRILDSDKVSRPAVLVAADDYADLALLRVGTPCPASAVFRSERAVRVGQPVLVMGFPLPGLLASDVIVSSGTINALAGLANDSTKVQISAPVQPGNSGGPLLDASGLVIGVVVSKLDAIKVAQAIGDIPQNVNFAIKGSVARMFLEANGVTPRTAVPGPARANEDIVAASRGFTVQIECAH